MPLGFLSADWGPLLVLQLCSVLNMAHWLPGYASTMSNLVPVTPLQNQPFCWVVVGRDRGLSEPLPWSRSFQGRGEETCVPCCWPSYPKGLAW